MKKTQYILLSALAISTIVACTEKQLQGPEVQDGIQITISASGEGAGTRTALAGGTGDDRNNVVFNESDELAVFDLSAQKSRFTIPSGGLMDDGSADFTGTVSEDDDIYYAIYPYSDDVSANMKTLSGTLVYSEISFEVPAQQQTVQGNFDPKAAFAAGQVIKSDGKYRTALNNLCALVKFSVPEGMEFSKAVFKANGDESIGGQGVVRINHSTGSLTSVTVSSDDVSEISLEGTITGGEWYYFSVLPQTLSQGFTVRLYDEEGVPVSSRATTKNVNLTRNLILNLGELPATTSIEWVGSGTSSDPYLIYTYEQLSLLAQRMRSKSSASSWQGKCYRQMADIGCGGKSIRIGGFDGSDPVFFTGTYDGNGYSIIDYVPEMTSKSNLLSRERYFGLFNQVKNATIKNLAVRPSILMAQSSEDEDGNVIFNAGALVGRAMSDESGKVTITNCSTIAGNEYAIALTSKTASIVTRVGGIVGRCEDCNLDISLCVNKADISINGGWNPSDKNYCEGLGGILGYAESDAFEQIIRIDKCRNKGDLRDYNQTAVIGAAGIVGTAYEATGTDETVLRISSCVNEGRIVANNPVDSFDNNGIYSHSESYESYAGGIVGCNDADGGTYNPYIYNCLNKGQLFAADVRGGAGGIAGFVYDDDTTIALCVNVGTFSGEEHTYFGAISAVGNNTYWPDEENARCVGCYWLDSQSDPSKAAIPLMADESDTAPHDCYCYPKITYEHPANRITNGWNTAETQWTQAQWDECASLWVGEAEYSQSLDAITLDLQF